MGTGLPTERPEQNSFCVNEIILSCNITESLFMVVFMTLEETEDVALPVCRLIEKKDQPCRSGLYVSKFP